MFLMTGVALAFSASVTLCWILCRPRFRFVALDRPNERSLHNQPVPRTGGLAILVAVAVAVLSLIGLDSSGYAGLPPVIATGAAIVGGVSFVDDMRGLSVGIRLATQCSVAILVTMSGFTVGTIELSGLGGPIPLVAGYVVSVVFVVWMINLYNFMDGMDGLAAGMAIFGFGTLAVFGWLADRHDFMIVNSIIAAAAGGFLLFNFSPARMFMGDSGSSTLGFLAAAVMLWGQREDVVPLWAGILVFSPFVTDATVTLCCRALRREKLWQAHRTHYYQRLFRLGWSHRQTTLSAYAVMAACAGSAVWLAGQPMTIWLPGMAVWAGIYLFLASMVSSMERRHLRQ